jgi:hypothetical protein
MYFPEAIRIQAFCYDVFVIDIPLGCSFKNGSTRGSGISLI